MIITGGEPSLQLTPTLVDRLHSCGRRVHVETNGTGELPGNVDWITCSPKTADCVLHDVDELKLVYQGQDVEAVASRFSGGQLLPAAVLVLQCGRDGGICEATPALAAVASDS